MFRQLILILVCGLSYIANYASPRYSFVRIDSNDGLSNNFVLSIHQDKSGFIWLGTMSGLNRYDGYGFKIIKTSSNIQEGLYNQRIVDIKEDNHGNLWLKSFGGMFQRYNMTHEVIHHYPDDLGYELTGSANQMKLMDNGLCIKAFMGLGVFVTDSNNNVTTHLFNKAILQKPTNIHFIYALDPGKIFLGTGSGLLMLDTESQTGEWSDFNTRYPSEEKNISFLEYCENDTTVFFITPNDGLFLFNKQSGELKRHTHINNIDMAGLNQIHKDQHNRIWICSSRYGLIGIQGKDSTIHITDYNGLAIRNVNYLNTDSEGLVWFHADNYQGIFQYTPSTGYVHYYSIDLSNSIQFRPNRLIQYIYEDSNNNLWIGTSADGVVFFDRKLNRVISYQNDPKNSLSISSNNQLSIFEDKSGVLWIGTRQGGVNKVNLRVKDFNSIVPNPNPSDRFHNEVGAIYANKDLWFSTNENILYYHPDILEIHPDDNTSILLDHSLQKKKKGRLCCLIKYSDGSLWAGSKREGLSIYHHHPDILLKDTPFMNYTNNPGDPESINNNSIYDITEDHQGNIWLASYGGGLILVTKKEGKIRFLPYNSMLNPRHPGQVMMGRCVLADSKDRIWYGGLDGIYRFETSDDRLNPVNIRFYQFKPGSDQSISYNDITTIYEDRSGTIWVGTYGGGLDRYVEESDQFANYSEKDGLPSDIIYGIIQDDQGFLWLSTENGLSRFNPATSSFINFFMNDGLLSSTFSEARPAKASNGTLFFGTINGLVFFKPWNIRQDTYIPDVLLATIKVSNMGDEPFKGSKGIKNINYLDHLILSYRQNNFSIEFVSTSYFYPEKNKFAYMLENYDEDFNYLGNQRKATYTNLEPGNYVLKIKASNNDGIWNPEPRTLTITIKPPLWRTSSAYLLYGCILLLCIFFSYKIISKINRLKNSLKIEQEVSKIKLRFFTNISHEFRNPLTLIINPLSDLLEGNQLADHARQLTALAHRNARQLLHLVNEILDLRKIQNNMMELKITENDVYCFFTTIVENFKYPAKKRDIAYTFSSNLEKSTAWFDVEKVEKIMTNLISNAIKFTQPGGNVTVTLNVNDRDMSISVHDTGVGFDIKTSPRMFTRFYQQYEQTDKLNRGTGIGLSLIRELTEIHKGIINIDSKPGVGSRFQIILPVNPAAYTPDQIVDKRKWIVGIHASLINENTSEPSHKVPKTQPIHKLLIVEDDPELLNYLVEKLSANYQVVTATNGADGFYRAQCAQPDMIITDVVMPQMDGIEMTRKLKHSFETSHIPVIMLTGKTGIEEKMEGFTTGADAFVEKPFDYNYLILRIENLISQRKMLRERYRNNVEMELNSIGKNNRDQEFLKKVEEYINIHVGSPDLSVELLYSNLGYSKTLFFNKIKSLTGHSPNNFIKTFRLRKAALLLKQNQYNVAEVANLVGYNDIDYFRKQFKAFFKTTPTEYARV